MGSHPRGKPLGTIKVGTGREHADQRGLPEPSSHVLKQKPSEHLESALVPAIPRQSRQERRPRHGVLQHHSLEEGPRRFEVPSNAQRIEQGVAGGKVRAPHHIVEHLAGVASRVAAHPDVGADERAGDEAVGGETAAEALGVECRRGARGGGGLEEGGEGVAVGARAAGEHGREEAQRGRRGRGRGCGGGEAEVRVGEAVVGEGADGGGGGGAFGAREQRPGGEEERVQLQEAAREGEVLLEEALEDGRRPAWVAARIAPRCLAAGGRRRHSTCSP
nr:unnamed protein product [Digitaria exilis]